MFVVIARYRVLAEHQETFVCESKAWYGQRQSLCLRRLFLRHRTSPEYLDILAEYADAETFLGDLRQLGPPDLHTPHETCERYLYDAL